jgi:hypothetical protein
VTKEELEKLLEQYPVPADYDYIDTFFLNFGPKDFFKQFCEISSPNSLISFYHDKGE